MRIKSAVTILAVLCMSILYSQDDYVVLRYDGPNHLIDQSKVVLLDPAGNIYVTGYSTSTANKEDYVTIKYNTLGQVQWVQRYDGPGHDIDVANAMAVDAAGNVYVTGKSRQSSSANTEEYCTIKYNTAGVQQWVARYDSPALCNYTYNEAMAIAVDDAGNVFITGDTRNTSQLDNITTIKYSPTGTQLWLNTYNGANNKEDIGKFLKLDRTGNVYVAGVTNITGHGYDYIVIKYNNAGAQQWIAKYNGTGNGDDILNGLAVDNGGNACVTGTSKGTGAYTEYATVVFKTGTGDTLWTKRFASLIGNAEGKAIIVDDYNSVYVTGGSAGPLSNLDMVTIKYDYTGTVVWMNKYDGPANGLDEGIDLKLRRLPCGPTDNPCLKFDIYVTGKSTGLATGFDYATVKYDEKGIMQWVKRYNNAANNDDIPSSIAINNINEFIYVTGTSNNDYATLWLVPSNNNSSVNNNTQKDFSLAQNYPNPFNPSTSISFSLPAASEVTLTIYDAAGKIVETTASGMMDAGVHSVSWNAVNYNSGVYFYKLQAGKYVETRKMVLIK